jgi:hypothetical protein
MPQLERLMTSEFAFNRAATFSQVPSNEELN